MKKKNKIKNSYLGFTIISTTILSIYTLGIIVLLLWAFLSSFKIGVFAFKDHLFGFPKISKEMFNNYIDVFKNLVVKVESVTPTKTVYFEGLLLNSILIAVGCTASTVLCLTIMSYVCAKYACLYTKILYTVVIVAMILPIVNSLPATMIIVRKLKIYDTFIGMLILKFNFLGMYFLIFYATFKGISWEYAEAAFIDGASNLKVFFRIMVPMASATVGTIFLLQFISYWNAYDFNLIFLPSMPTIAYGLYRFSVDPSNSVTVPMQFAAAILLAIPMIVIFAVLKDKIIGSVSIGGLKE